MNKFLHIVILIVVTSCSDPQLTSSDKLVEKDNISYFGNSNTPYTGEVIDYHSNQNIKMTGKFLDGKKQGQWDIFFYHPKNGEPVKQYEEFYTNGEKNGKFVSFENDGKTVKSITEWKKGSFVEYLEFRDRRRSLEKWIYHKNDKIFEISYPVYSEYNNEYVFAYKDYVGEIRCKVTDKNTNKSVTHFYSFTNGREYLDGLSFQEWLDCELNGKTEIYRGGYISEKGFYKDNKKTGKWITFDSSTGSPSEIENYKNGEYHGLVQRFDEGILYNQEKFDNGFLIEEKQFNKDGQITYVETHTRDYKITEEYTTPFEYFTPLYDWEFSHLSVFFTVMGVEWEYVHGACTEDVLKNQYFIDCVGAQRDVIEPNLEPIKIKTSFNRAGVKDGLLEISDPEDGHVYTRINYSRDAKLGEYKIYNKEGLIIYSVNCLLGGSAYFGNCRKDGEEIMYIRSPFTKEKKWYLYSKRIFENDEIVSSEFYKDPFRTKELSWGKKIQVPYEENEYTLEYRPVRLLGKGGGPYVIPKETK